MNVKKIISDPAFDRPIECLKINHNKAERLKVLINGLLEAVGLITSAFAIVFIAALFLKS